MFGMHFSAPIQVAMEAAWTVGQKLASGDWLTETRTKAHPTFGTASVSDADENAQEMATRIIRQEFPDALIVGEEKSEGSTLSLQEILSAPLVFYLDMLDGSTSHEHDDEAWSSSIGIVQYGRHIGGVINAPDIRGGLLVAGEINKGAFLWERGSLKPKKLVASEMRKPAKPVVCLGLDVMRTDWFWEFLKAMPKKLRPRNSAPSGALGLAKVAAGRCDCIIQYPQFPWDVFGGIPICEEAGWKLQYYIIEDGKVVLIPKLIAECYRTDKQVLGIIGGHAELVEELTPLFIEHYGK